EPSGRRKSRYIMHLAIFLSLRQPTLFPDEPYLNYAREHWVKPGENPPVGLILCAEKGAAEAHYALEGLPNKVLAAEYQTVLPDEKLLAEELAKTRLELDARNV
ncbi:PDDEXK nuclease domain-containing protein, partial [Cupriavidus sp. UYPR2.512]|uniref:PDDEXK nuclease domain-containing protein n=1 Tax=Cupriavidus sp. UYPR2.512 TaxID=1080187 RepID=UPI001E4ED410